MKPESGPPPPGGEARFSQPIAIVGMGGVFPGSPSLADFWRIVDEGRDTCRTVPAGRWLLDPGTIQGADPGAPDSVLNARGCFIGEAAPPGGLDPMFDLLLRAGRAAFAESRTENLALENVGVVLGNIALPTAGSSALCDEVLVPLFEQKLFNGNEKPRSPATNPLNRYVTGLPAGLLARDLGLGGACFTLDAACASSLYAVKLACDELLAGRADAMLAGGLSRPDSLYTQMGFTQLRALSPSGRCSPFDRKGDGLIVGEGAGVVVLKRLDDALRDGDRILALIRGIGLSNDIEGKLLSPSSEGQLRALRSAYAQAGWSPDMVDLIECHATGTPVGDAVEFESLARLWEGGRWRAGQCVLSAVKSNIGHLLTAAGSAGLIKTLLALQHGRLPPVANYESPSARLKLEGSPFSILRQGRAWERRAAGVPRRAAINGFGFGGINAHLLIEEWLGEPAPAARGASAPAPEPVAIVGMAARVGRWPNLDAFRDRVLYGNDGKNPVERKIWRGLSGEEIRGVWGRGFPGHYLDDLSVPIERFHIPPREMAEMLPQQLLMLEVAKSALDDARNPAFEPPRAGVFIGIGLDLRSTDFHFRWTMKNRAAALAQKAGLAQGSAEARQWMAELCDGAGPPLTADRTLGALGGIVASRVAREFRIGGPSHGIASEDTSGLRALEAGMRALQQRELDVVLAGAVDLNGDLRTLLATDGVRPYSRDGRNGVIPGEGAACVVLKRLAEAERDGDRIYAVIRGIGSSSGTYRQALARAYQDGGVDPASVGLIEANGSGDPAEDALEAQALSEFFGLGERAVPRGVSSAKAEVGHTGAASGLVSLVKAGLCLHHEVLPANLPGAARPAQYWVRDRADGPRRAGVSAMGVAGDCIHVVLEGSERAPARPPRPYPAVYTPKGISDQPPGRVALVFPGSGNQVGDMGREIALQFPEILRVQDRENARLASQLRPDLFWCGPLAPGTHADHRALISGQVAFGTMMADLAMRFGLRPDAAIGYSLGESTALLALRAWRQRDEMLDRLGRSTLFARDLAGGPDWSAGMVDRSAEAVRAAIAGRKGVYLLIANTPDECVIGGDRGVVAQVVAELGSHWFPLQGVSTVHCELAHPVRKAYRDLHRFDTEPPPGIEFYSCAWGRAYVPDRETAADAIEAQAMGTIDFPRVIRAAYDAGVRTFVEVGPGASCTRMIGKILEGRPHFARSLAATGQPPVAHFLRTLGELHAAGVPLDLELLRGIEVRKGQTGPAGKCVTVSIAGAAFTVPPIPKRKQQTTEFADALYRSMVDTERATVAAHEAYLRFSENLTQTLAQAIAAQSAPAGVAVAEIGAPPRTLDRAACLEFARGLVGRALGPEYAQADAFPTRVRLPDEPLMLVDRILEVEGEPLSMTHGRVLTEHDIRAGAWYLDCGRIPTCIAVEAGQADLFLSGFLGIDFQTRGLAMYRLLDAKVCFHRGLPGPGETIRYDIRIDHFFRQGATWLFRFAFEATAGGRPLLTMTDGCAGFFSNEELAAGKGIVRTALDLKPAKGKRAEDWQDFVPVGDESYSAAQLDALRAGDLAACFGDAFSGLPLRNPVTLPGGRMRLVHRIVSLDPNGGRFGLGRVAGEADIRPDDWFLTCHFVDDRVMPGTLMFECCLHTLRVYLLRLGWVAEEGQVAMEPVPGVASQLKCRGQVLDTTRTVRYEVSVKEIGYGPEPYVVADALMYADGKPIVEITSMSLRLAGTTRESIAALWKKTTSSGKKQAIFDTDRILAFATGKPSDAFGEPYRVFDEERVIARLPGPPYQFLDRITEIRAQPWKILPGAEVEAQYDVPPDAWYFADNRQGDMPFAVLLEIALQPCGWLAAYMGSALTSEVDVSFRNLGGGATQFVPVFPDIGTLSVRVKLTRASSSAGMIIQFFDYEVRAGRTLVYKGDTYFGFFPKVALLKQEGLKDAKRHRPEPPELARGRSLDFPSTAPMPAGRLRLLDRIDTWIRDGGTRGLGFIRATRRVVPDEWFFKAHFHQDPVVPGSLGLESFLQLLKFVALERWGDGRCEAVAAGERHEWTYRGQVVPADREVTVEAEVTAVDEAGRLLRADGFLSVDGRVIYAMKDFTLRHGPAGIC